MSETLEQFIVRRRGELDEESAKLQAQLRVIDAEREKVDKVAMMYAEEPTPTVPSTEGFATFLSSQKLVRDRSPKRVSEATIKEMVLDILEREEGDLTALAILDRINIRAGIEYPRTSLSPQLSRLKAEGKIHREGRFWSLGGGPDIEEAAGSDDEDQETQTDEAPTEVGAS